MDELSPGPDIQKGGRRIAEAGDSTLRLVTFMLGDSRFGISLHGTERAFRMAAIAPLPGAPTPVVGAINLRGRVVPVVDLRVRFGLVAQDYGLDAHLLVVRTARRRLAILADEVVGVRAVPESSIEPAKALVAGQPPLVGVVALTDGLLLIQDLEALLSSDEDEALDRALGTA
jgi:purine-binding chemotaxis protein CheW